MFNVNNWTGPVVVIVLVCVVLGVLLASPEVLNPISAQGDGEERRLKNEHLQRMYALEEAQKQLELDRAQQAYDLAVQRAQQNLEQEREQHDRFLAFLNRYLPVLLVGVALGLASLGAGAGYFLYCRGLEMREKRRRAATGANGKRIVQFPTPPQDRQAAG
jgi:hypothetical protein